MEQTELLRKINAKLGWIAGIMIGYTTLVILAFVLGLMTGGV